MFLKIVLFIFYAALALFFFGVAFAPLEIIIGLCALVLAIVQLMG